MRNWARIPFRAGIAKAEPGLRLRAKPVIVFQCDAHPKANLTVSDSIHFVGLQFERNSDAVLPNTGRYLSAVSPKLVTFGVQLGTVFTLESIYVRRVRNP